MRFDAREVRDLLAAWLALGLAFAIFFDGRGAALRNLLGSPSRLGVALAVSLVTAGVAFLGHELAHKFVAVRYGQLAAFRADYGMLFLAVMSALIGFLFAAPGAVRHRGRLTDRQHGVIALAGPAANVVMAVPFAAVWLVSGDGLAGVVGGRGLAINLFLAAFNLVPIRSLDGATVRKWNVAVWLGAFLPALALAVVVVFVLGVGFASV